MSHHSSESLGSSLLDDAFSKDLSRAKKLLHDEQLGATGQYPHGKLCPQDEGEIKIAIAADPKNQVVLIDFGKPVASIGFTPKEAHDIANMLIEKAFACRGIV